MESIIHQEYFLYNIFKSVEYVICIFKVTHSHTQTHTYTKKNTHTHKKYTYTHIWYMHTQLCHAQIYTPHSRSNVHYVFEFFETFELGCVSWLRLISFLEEVAFGSRAPSGSQKRTTLSLFMSWQAFGGYVLTELSACTYSVRTYIHTYMSIGVHTFNAHACNKWCI